MQLKESDPPLPACLPARADADAAPPAAEFEALSTVP